MSQPKLLIRLPNWVGDVMMALPSINALHQNFSIELIGKPWITNLLAGLQLPCYPLAKSFKQNQQIIKNLTTKKCLLLLNSFSSALLARLAGKEAIGYATDWRNLLLQHSIKPNKNAHEVEYFWRISKWANQIWNDGNNWPDEIPKQLQLPLTTQQQTTAQQILQAAQINSPYWVIAPFATGTNKQGDSKVWPHWQELITHLTQHNIRCVICPGPNEIALAKPYKKLGATILTNVSLGSYAAILAKADNVIANDSGPMHIATAVGANTLGIFGATNPQRTHPWNGNTIGEYLKWPSIAEVIQSVSHI